MSVDRIRHLLGSWFDRGAAAVEYVILLAAITAMIVIIALSLGISTKADYDQTCGVINSPDHTAASC
jgi:Flp pilus assembly pilin Flp